MKENRYDDEVFFQKYAQMDRSQKGLAGAGEWPALQKILPDFTGRRVLDLGCGYGWHCKYAAEHGARAVLGIDLSEKMLRTARERKTRPRPSRTGAPPWRTSISRTARLTSCSARWPFTTRRIFPRSCVQSHGGSRQTAASYSRRNTRSSRPSAARIGFTARTAKSSISRSTAISTRGPATPSSWGNTSKNTTAH